MMGVVEHSCCILFFLYQNYLGLLINLKFYFYTRILWIKNGGIYRVIYMPIFYLRVKFYFKKKLIWKNIIGLLHNQYLFLTLVEESVYIGTTYYNYLLITPPNSSTPWLITPSNFSTAWLIILSGLHLEVLSAKSQLIKLDF